MTTQEKLKAALDLCALVERRIRRMYMRTPKDYTIDGFYIEEDSVIMKWQENWTDGDFGSDLITIQQLMMSDEDFESECRRLLAEKERKEMEERDRKERQKQERDRKEYERLKKQFDGN